MCGCSWRPSSFSSQHSHLEAHNYLQLQLQGSCPLLVSLGSTLVCAYPPYRHIYIHIIRNRIKKYMTRQKQGFLFMFTKRDSLLGLEQELCAPWWDRKKAVEKGCLFATHFLSILPFLLLLWAEGFINMKLFYCILKPWLVLLIMKWALTGRLALDRVQFYIYILSCVVFFPTSLSLEAKIH